MSDTKQSTTPVTKVTTPDTNVFLAVLDNERTVVTPNTVATHRNHTALAPRGKVPDFCFSASDLVSTEMYVQAADAAGIHAVTALASVVGVSEDGYILTLVDMSATKGWF